MAKLKINEASKRIQRYFELAKRMAKESTYGKLRHGAVLVKGGSIISVGLNKGCYCKFGNRFRDSYNFGHATQHAEISAVLGVGSGASQGSSIYVARVNNHNQYRMSKPCGMCHDALKFVGVKKAYYTTGENTYEECKIGDDGGFQHQSQTHQRERGWVNQSNV